MELKASVKTWTERNLSRSRVRSAVTNPGRFLFRGLNAARWHIRSVMLNLFCDGLLSWGTKIGVSGNFRARMLWKAGRRDIVPVPVLYDFMEQEKAQGQYYSTAPEWSSRSQTVINILESHISKEARILEIGCNSGRNLNHLWRAGYKALGGIEISKHAANRLREAYPCLANIPIDIGPAEKLIRKYSDRSVDVILTMAMLEHLHPDNKVLFNEIARVAGKYVLAVESRFGKRSHMQYPWDIKSEFTAVGLSCIEIKPWSALWPRELSAENEWTDDLHEYEAFLFAVNR
jgi:SAM-dependent methyltransferase